MKYIRSLFTTGQKHSSADIERIRQNFYKMSAFLLVFVVIVQMGIYFAQMSSMEYFVAGTKAEMTDRSRTAIRNGIRALSNAIKSYLHDYENAVDTFMYNGAIAYQEYERQHNPTREQGNAFAQKTRITEFEIFKPDGNLLYATIADIAENSLNLFSIWNGYRAIVDGSENEIKSTIKIRVETGEIFKFTAVPRLDKNGNINGIIEACLNIEDLEAQIASFLNNYSQVLSMHLFSLSDGFTLVSIENKGARVNIPRGKHFEIDWSEGSLFRDGEIYNFENERVVYYAVIHREGVGDSYILQLEFDENYYTAPAASITNRIDSVFNRLSALYSVSMIVCVLIAVILIIAYAINMNRVILSNMEQLAEQTKLADEANQAKSRFLATMSHEIRTPMNAIIGIAEIILAQDDTTGSLHGNISKIHTAAKGLLGIINDILDLSKIETGKMELAPAPYSLPELLNDAVSLNITRIGGKPIKFTLRVEENLPVNLVGDELRLKQILNNILSNAFKYTDKGSVELSVSHRPDGGAVMLIFQVSDSGQGMKPEDLQKLFSEYDRFNMKANRATEGTGLGLAITKRLAEMMGGVISVRSEYGKGSVFTVNLRQDCTDKEVLGAELADKLRNLAFARTTGQDKGRFALRPAFCGRVLVVDDVEVNLYVAEEILSLYGLNVETADSGFAALDKIKDGRRYDIIFLDHMMPGMDGIETIGKIRATGYTAPIVALTANAIAGNDKMFIENGFDDFLSKPIDSKQLGALIGKYIGQTDEAAKDGAC